MIYPTRRLVGLAALAALLAFAALAFAWLAALAWIVLAIVAALALIDGRLSLRRGAPHIERELPQRGRVREPLSVRYRLSLAGAAQATLLDELPADLGGDHSQGPLAIGDEPLAIERQVTPERRGVRALGPVIVDVRSPLGLFDRRHRAAQGRTLSVYPADVLAGAYGPRSRKLRDELGIRPRRQRGEGSEFESLREYTPDDEPRRIDWRATARARRPVVRELQIERHHTVIVAVDTGRLMGSQIEGLSKLDHALGATVGLIRASSRAQDRIGFLAFDSELCAWVPPQPSKRALGAILEATLELEARTHESSYRTLAEALQQRQKKRSLLVVLTDFVEGAAAAELQAYLASLASRHAVLLVGLRDRLLRELDTPAPAIAGQALFRRLALQDLDAARDIAFSHIARSGVHTLDLDPAAVTGPLLDRYLQIREAEFG